MTNFASQHRIESFKKKLLLTSKEEIIDLFVEKLAELAELQELYATSFEKEVGRVKQHESIVGNLQKELKEHTTTLRKIHDLLDKSGYIYPDTSLEGCIQGLIIDVEILREQTQNAKS